LYQHSGFERYAPLKLEKQMMGILSISELEPDMVIAGDLKDRSGRLLMIKGTVLTSKHIKICKMWGVVEAEVEGISCEDVKSSVMKQFDPAEIAAAEEIIRQRFSHNDMNHPAVLELFRLCTLRKVAGQSSDVEHIENKTQIDEAELLTLKRSEINPMQYIKEDTNLSTLPDIYRQVTEAISKPDSSAHDIANVIGKDTNLSARLLKIVNSAFYGYPSKIDTLSRAVNIVGTKQLTTLAIGINMIHMFKNIPSQIINMKLFWKHSVLCGITARLIAGYKNIQNTERMFVAGLLHDIGRLLLYNYLPQQSLQMIKVARHNHDLLFNLERNTLTCGHPEIGGELLKKWKLPTSLEDIVRHHHNPQNSQNHMETAIVHLADIMANAVGIGSSGEQLVPSLNHDSWAQIGLSTNILSLTMEQADQQFEDMFESIYADDAHAKTI
jgi:putative nucleotidyltransferase with HDIG domain